MVDSKQHNVVREEIMKINITLPVYNEEDSLEKSIGKLISFLQQTKFPYDYEIVIADNASKDKTQSIGERLEKEIPNVRYHRIDRKGRGYALKQVWSQSDCDVCSYMDIDLSTDLAFFRPMIEAVIFQSAVVSTGSRLEKESKVIGRIPKREFLSRGYNALIKLLFWPPFKDAQCGFKCVNTYHFKQIVTYISNNNWFFDTEMMLLTHQLKRKIISIPVVWTDDCTTTVKLGPTIKEDLGGLFRLRWLYTFQNMRKVIR